MSTISFVKVDVPRPATSFTKLVPRYEAALIRRKWEDYCDAGRSISVTEIPALLAADYNRKVPDVEFERQRLRAEYRRGPNGQPLFDTVYPGTSFDREYAAALELDNPNSSDVVHPVDMSTLAIAIKDDLTKISGIGPATCEQFYRAGLNTFKEVADADIETLEKIDGISAKSAAKVQRAATQLAP